MPSTRNEEYRFTDVSALLGAALVSSPADAAINTQLLEQLAVPEATGSRVVLVNGAFRPDLSDLSAVAAGIYVGSAAGAPAESLQYLVSDGGPSKCPVCACRFCACGLQWKHRQAHLHSATACQSVVAQQQASLRGCRHWCREVAADTSPVQQVESLLRSCHGRME